MEYVGIPGMDVGSVGHAAGDVVAIALGEGDFLARNGHIGSGN